MSTLFDPHNHKYQKLAVVQAGSPANSALVDHQVCAVCGWDPIDNVYRCTQIGCGKQLTQLEADGHENKCSTHRTLPPAGIDKY